MSLSEVSARYLQQTDPGLHKRWFADEELDVTLWQEEDSGAISHFQIVFRGQEMVEWDSVRGLRVGRIQDYAGPAGMKSAKTYILASATDASLVGRVRQEFAGLSQDMASNVREFLLATLDGDEKRVAAVTFEKPAARPAPPPPPPECGALSIALKTPLGILTSMQEFADKGWELMALSRSFCVFERRPGVPLRKLSYLVRNITLKFPRQILAVLNEAGRTGMTLAGAGGSYLFLKTADSAGTWEFRMEGSTLRGAGGVRALVERLGREGWHLCALGLNFAFFQRPAGSILPIEHKSLRCRQLGFPGRLAREIEAAVARECGDGFRTCALGSGLIVFRRPAR